MGSTGNSLSVNEIIEAPGAAPETHQGWPAWPSLNTPWSPQRQPSCPCLAPPGSIPQQPGDKGAEWVMGAGVRMWFPHAKLFSSCKLEGRMEGVGGGGIAMGGHQVLSLPRFFISSFCVCGSAGVPFWHLPHAVLSVSASFHSPIHHTQKHTRLTNTQL